MSVAPISQNQLEVQRVVNACQSGRSTSATLGTSARSVTQSSSTPTPTPTPTPTLTMLPCNEANWSVLNPIVRNWVTWRQWRPLAVNDQTFFSFKLVLKTFLGFRQKFQLFVSGTKKFLLLFFVRFYWLRKKLENNKSRSNNNNNSNGNNNGNIKNKNRSFFVSW